MERPDRMIRVAFDAPERGVMEVPVSAVEAALRDSWQQYTFLTAEYVELDSPFTEWKAIRRYGYSCRAFAPLRKAR